jgi:hypothetical protein
MNAQLVTKILLGYDEAVVKYSKVKYVWKRRCSFVLRDFRLQEVGQGPHGDG